MKNTINSESGFGELSNFNMESEKDGKAKINNTMVYLLAAVLIALIIFIAVDKLGGSVSSSEMKNRAEGFINTQLIPEGGVSVDSLKKESGIYVAEVTYQGQSIPLYFTTDGKFISPGKPLYDLTSTNQPVMGNNAANSNTNANAPQGDIKSDKPVAEAFIFSYCPYGLQFEKALFPAYDLLKNKVDFRIVAIGAMHGEFEKVETLRQISIEKLYEKDKLFSYLKEFNMNTNMGNCRGDDSCLNKYLPSIYAKIGADKTKIENYMKSDAEKIYNEQNARANSLGIGGSPTFVINGVQVQVNRDANSIKEAICKAFNTAPSECLQMLSTQSASPGFG